MKIEKAIATLKGLTLCGICTGSDNGCKSCDRYNAKLQAIEALQEKQEREKGCEYCNSGLAPLYQISTNGSPTFKLYEPKCCPNCGRKLGENNG